MIQTTSIEQELEEIQSNGEEKLARLIGLPDGRTFAWFKDVASNSVGLNTPLVSKQDYNYTMKNKLGFLAILFITACTQQSNDVLVGKWTIIKVIQGGDIIREHDPFNERFLTLKKDSSFISGGKPSNTGRYFFNTKEDILFLDSDMGTWDDSRWRVRIQNDTMYWQGYGSQLAEDFQVIHIRDKN